MAQELNFIQGFVNAFKKSQSGAIIAVLCLACAILGSKWSVAEANLNKCYQETTQQEKVNSMAKETAAKETAELNYKFGVLIGKIEMLEKKIKK